MARAAPRTSVNSSTLVRLLSELAVVDVEVSRQPFAERLGLWLDWTAAIPLSAALNTSIAAPAAGGTRTAPAPCAAAAAVAAAAAEAVARVRAELSHLIATDAVLAAGTADPRRSGLAAGVAADNGGDFSAYRRCYQAHQRVMQARTAPLRAQVREALALQSPALRKLAALDGVLDAALGSRERSLLSTVPALLERRFQHLQRAHLGAQARTEKPDAPEVAPEPPPDAWLAAFGTALQGVLLAEMDIRLQPVEGLLEALRNEVATLT